MRRFALMLVLLSSLALIAGTCPSTAQCPMHEFASYCHRTGRTKWVYPHEWAEYACPKHHTFWISCD